MAEPIRYLDDGDSARWLDFEFRDGDIVISTRSKSGTTWVQMICALLIFDRPDLPRPLPELSPWLDWLVLPKDDVFDDLAAQTHRRFVKTHTPLDGLPLDDRVTYIVVARHPLDATASLYHQILNINRERLAELIGEPDLAQPRQLPPLDEWLADWIESEESAQEDLDSFGGMFHHLTDAWNRKDQPNVVLVHYADLLHDLNGEMKRIAGRLGIDVADERVDELAHAATFTSMQAARARPVSRAHRQEPLLPFRKIRGRQRRPRPRRSRCVPRPGIPNGAPRPPRLAAPGLNPRVQRNRASACSWTSRSPGSPSDHGDPYTISSSNPSAAARSAASR